MKYTLRTRILFVLLIVFTLLSGTTAFVHQQILLPSFLALERKHIDSNVQRVIHALDNETHHLYVLASDWSIWDDTYDYIEDHNIEYETSNLVGSSFSGSQINLIYLLDNSGKTVWGKAVADDFETVIDVQPFDQDFFPADFPLFQYQSDLIPLDEQNVSGLIMTSAGPMLCSAIPVLDSNASGPSRGTLIMGRLLSTELIQKISQLTGIDYTAKPISNPDKPSVAQNSASITYQGTENSLTASTLYTDITGEPALKITIYEQRDILEQGAKALRISLTLMFAGITCALALMMLMLQRSAVSPINKITRNIVTWHQTKQPWQNVEGVCVTKEICTLSQEFGQLIESLDNKNSQLAETNLTLVSEARKLKEAQSFLKNLDQLKSEFISTAAHELRTPVAIIMGYTELLTDPEMSAPFDEEQRKDFINEIFESSERLTKIIDDILDVSRIEAGQSIPLDKQSISTEVLLGKIANQFKIKAKHQISLKISPGTPETIKVDDHRINQVMENLLSNAIKYSPSNSEVLISAEREGRHCKVSVTDKGIGMTEQQVARIFDKFYRADASDTAVRGLGLGMSIVKQIIEDHSGTIWVESSLGEGTKVYFTLPIEKQENK